MMLGPRFGPVASLFEVPTMVKTDSRKVNQRRRLRRQRLESRARLQELRATPPKDEKKD
jgi:hypothetical protein